MPRPAKGRKLVCFYLEPELKQAIDILKAVDGLSQQDWLESLIEREVKNRKDSLPISKPEPGLTIAQIINDNWVVLAEDSGIKLDKLLNLAKGAKPTEPELNKLAESLDKDIDELQQICDRNFPHKKENGNNAAKS